MSAETATRRHEWTDPETKREWWCDDTGVGCEPTCDLGTQDGRDALGAYVQAMDATLRKKATEVARLKSVIARYERGRA